LTCSRTAYHREYAKKRRATAVGKAQNAGSSRAWRDKEYKYVMLSTARCRAKKNGVEFSLVPEDLEWPTHCPILGVEIEYRGRGRGALSNSASLDRLDNSKGYVAGNVFVISWRANRIKNDATAEEHRKIAAWIDSKLL
jgi:hypothetical protein